MNAYNKMKILELKFKTFQINFILSKKLYKYLIKVIYILELGNLLKLEILISKVMIIWKNNLLK